jgi:hypothetical protein
MANTNSPFGGKPINTMTSTDFTGKTHVYSSSISDATKIYVNDFVKLGTGSNSKGVPYAAQGTSTGDLVGVVIGIQNFITKETQIFRAANTELALYVIDDPYAEFEVQINGTIAATDIGKEANLIIAAGDDTIGISRIQLDVTTLTASGGQVKILGLAERDDNVIGAYSKVRVVIVKHAYTHQTFDDIWTRDAITGEVSTVTPGDNVHIGGKLTVDGLIDPTGIVLTPQAIPPTSADASFYYDSVLKAFQFKANGTYSSIPPGNINNLSLPATTATVGQIKWNDITYFHVYGNDNMFMGREAGNYTLIGTTNLAAGINSLHSAWTASYNTFFGYHGGQNITDADQNTGIGAAVFPNLITGKYNLGAGYAAGIAYTGAESYNIVLYNSGVTGESRVIRIGTHGSGDGQQNKAFIAGIYNIVPTSTTRKTVIIGNDYQLTTSDYPITTITNSITAHPGGGQADATSLTAATNIITICANDHDSVMLNPTAPCVGLIMRVVNASAKTCAVYPISGSTMNGILDASYNAVHYTTEFQMTSSTDWRVILN